MLYCIAEARRLLSILGRTLCRNGPFLFLHRDTYLLIQTIIHLLFTYLSDLACLASPHLTLIHFHACKRRGSKQRYASWLTWTDTEDRPEQILEWENPLKAAQVMSCCVRFGLIVCLSVYLSTFMIFYPLHLNDLGAGSSVSYPSSLVSALSLSWNAVLCCLLSPLSSISRDVSSLFVYLDYPDSAFLHLSPPSLCSVSNFSDKPIRYPITELSYSRLSVTNNACHARMTWLVPIRSTDPRASDERSFDSSGAAWATAGFPCIKSLAPTICLGSQERKGKCSLRDTSTKRGLTCTYIQESLD
ncbi:hypothetical protein GGR51DRAFT_303858 [Nemania sp. FL0031]|nr:hypothetical protein GGR51DRAFT_303858 [Nemania sp. FL0031]